MLQKDALSWIRLAETLGTQSKDFKQLISFYENP